jgi:hypothetical protein
VDKQLTRSYFYLAALSVLLFLSCLKSSGIAGELEECRRLAPKYNAEVEVVLWDKTRVDLLNDEYAIEVDWAKGKWKEAPAQAAWYSIVTGKKPAVLLLVKDWTADARDIYRATAVCERLQIKLFLEKVDTE